ncbi:hypothetical protein QTO34_000941 [Cnephaeus nilssonii]|uniref:Uncharacterized protein n=1 Tax=Cnephaeus nilssonii TaxID=3371016 RepID=A0AA40ICD5_CNENI|nr:hypothetical protein QTO34_000941 [Eptesicus nilssonii]
MASPRASSRSRCNRGLRPRTSVPRRMRRGAKVCNLGTWVLLGIAWHAGLRGRERERELETSMREKHPSAASCTPPTGDVPATKVHALDRNRTRDPSVHRPTLV